MKLQGFSKTVPCADMVRFTKTGSDATTSLYAFAGFYKRDKVAICGYTTVRLYIGATTKNLGIPECVRDLTLSFEYNSISSLYVIEKNKEELQNHVAYEFSVPKSRHLQQVRELQKKLYCSYF